VSEVVGGDQENALHVFCVTDPLIR
jgi:hypothetical protein